MDQRLRRTDLDERYVRFGSDLVVQFASLLQGAILSAAGFALIEIVQTSEQFAILSTDHLPGDGWRWWYVGAVALFASSTVSNMVAVRSTAATHYADEMRGVFELQRSVVRRQINQGAAATVFTAGLTGWLFAMPQDWFYATWFVALHLVLTLVNGAVNVRIEVLDARRLRAEVTKGGSID